MFLLLCLIPCFSGVIMPSFLPLSPFGMDWRAQFYGLVCIGMSMLLIPWGIVLTVRTRRGIFGLATFVASIPLLLVIGDHLA